jgi:hypothetical protein
MINTIVKGMWLCVTDDLTNCQKVEMNKKKPDAYSVHPFATIGGPAEARNLVLVVFQVKLVIISQLLSLGYLPFSDDDNLAVLL